MSKELENVEDLDFDSGLEEQNEETVIDPIKQEEPVKEEEVVVEEKKPRGRPKTKKEDEPTKGTEINDEPENKTGELDNPEPKEENSEETLIETMSKQLGFEIPEGVEFEDSEEGLAKFVEYVAEEKGDQMLNAYLESLPPEAADFFDYLQMLGDEATPEKIKAFFTAVNPEVNYKEIDLTDSSVQKAVIKTFFKKNEYTDEEIKELLDDAELAGTLEKQAKIAANKLAAHQEKERSILLDQQKQADAAKKQATKAFFDQVGNTINSGKVNNFTIPVNERKAQLEYDTKGEFMKDLNEILKDPVRRVELGIAIKNKFNLSKYIQTAAATQKANSLRDKLKGGQSKMKNGASYDNVLNSEIDFED